MDEQVRAVRLDYSVRASSNDAKLMNYFDSLTELTRKDAMLQAIRSYWLPLALKNAGATGVDLEMAAFNSVVDLVRQAKQICLEVGIDSGQFVGLLLGSAGAVPGMTIPTVQQQSVSTSAEVKTASSELESDQSPQSHKPKHENLWGGVDLDAGGFEDFPVNAVD